MPTAHARSGSCQLDTASRRYALESKYVCIHGTLPEWLKGGILMGLIHAGCTPVSVSGEEAPDDSERLNGDICHFSHHS